MKYEDLLNEAYENIKSDRKRLIDALQDIKNSAGDDPTNSGVVVKAAVMITEGLVKSNAQLVELVKIEAKSKPEDEETSLSDKETNSLFDSIEESSDTVGEN